MIDRKNMQGFSFDHKKTMMVRLIRVRKIERLFHLIDPVRYYSSASKIDKTHSKEHLEWKYIKLHFR